MHLDPDFHQDDGRGASGVGTLKLECIGEYA